MSHSHQSRNYRTHLRKTMSHMDLFNVALPQIILNSKSSYVRRHVLLSLISSFTGCVGLSMALLWHNPGLTSDLATDPTSHSVPFSTLPCPYLTDKSTTSLGSLLCFLRPEKRGLLPRIYHLTRASGPFPAVITSTPTSIEPYDYYLSNCDVRN